MAMCGSGVPALEQERWPASTRSRAAGSQRADTQVTIDPEGLDADFWYLGCIDAIVVLIAVDHVRRTDVSVCRIGTAR